MTNAKINPDDTTVLFRDHETDYLLVSAHSARVATANLERARKEIAEQAAPLHERVLRSRKVGAAIRTISGIAVAAGTGAVVWDTLVRALPSGYEGPIWALLIAGVLGFVCGVVAEGRADAIARKAAAVEGVSAVELLGGVFLPEEEFPLPDGSLLINLRNRSARLRMAAESLTRGQRDQVVALTKRGLLEQAVEALELMGQEETDRQVQEAVRDAEGKRPPRARGPLRLLRGRA